MIVLKKVKPMFTNLITTADKYATDLKTNGGIIDTSKAGSLKEYQTVLAIGPDVRCVKVGDLVCINPDNYAVRKYDKSSTKEAMTEHYNAIVGYRFNFLEINDELCLKLRDSDIDYVVEEFEEKEEEVITSSSGLILPDSKIILP